MADADQLPIMILLVIAGSAMVIAFVHGGSWNEKNPKKLGFVWGFFTIYNVLIGNVLLILALLAYSIDEEDLGYFIVCSIALAVALLISYYAIKRRKWALVVSTLLSLNPLWILINIFYLKNRWIEFSEESFERRELLGGGGGSKSFSTKLIAKEIRLAIFAAIAWAVAVPIFVFVFGPYGNYMNDENFLHMLGSMIFPIVAGFALFFGYQKFVR